MKNIIVLDSRAYTRYRVKESVGDKEYMVYETCNSRELFMKISELNSEVDLIVMEINLKNEDGFQILKDIRNKNIKTPIMILTDLNSKEDVIKSVTLGANDYFLKPFREEVIRKRISKNIDPVLGEFVELKEEYKRKELRLKDYLKREIVRAKSGKYTVSVIMTLFYKDIDNNLEKLDREYLSLSNYMYNKLKQVAYSANKFDKYSIQSFAAIYLNCDGKRASELLEKLNSSIINIKDKDKKIKPYRFESVSVTYPEDGDSYEAIIKKLEEKMKDKVEKK